MTESASPTFTLQLGTETRTLMYGFRAFKTLGINPFDPASLSGFVKQLTIDTAAEWVRAGLLWEYAKGQPRHGEEPPTAEDLIDLIHFGQFMQAFGLSLEAAGLSNRDGDEEPQEPAGPPNA